MPDHAGWFALLAQGLLKLFPRHNALLSDKGCVRLETKSLKLTVRWDRVYQPPKR